MYVAAVSDIFLVSSRVTVQHYNILGFYIVRITHDYVLNNMSTHIAMSQLDVSAMAESMADPGWDPSARVTHYYAQKYCEQKTVHCFLFK